MALPLNPNVVEAPIEGFAPVLEYMGSPGFLSLAPAQHYIAPAPHVIEAVVEAAKQSHCYGYGMPSGESALVEAIAEKLSISNGIDVGTSTGVRITHGAGHALLIVLMAFLSPGDEVLSPDPSFPLNWYIPSLLGARTIGCRLDGPEGVAGLPDRMADAVTSRTKAIIVHSVNNPTGHVLEREILERIAEIAVRHDLLVLADEVFESFAFEDRRNFSIATLPGMAERTATVFSFSKDHNLPGLRVGYVAASSEIVRAIDRIVLNGPVGTGVIGQYGALAALQGPPDHLHRIVMEFGTTRKAVVERLNAIPGVACDLPEGGFFVFPDVSDISADVDSLFLGLARDAGLGVAAGSWYGEGGAGHLRICYGAAPPPVLDEFLDRFSAYLASYEGP